MHAWGEKTTAPEAREEKDEAKKEDKKEDADGKGLDKKRARDAEAEKSAEERGSKEAKTDTTASAKEVDSDLRAFFDGKSKQKGFKENAREKRFGTAKEAPKAKEPVVDLSDPEKAAEAAKQLEAKIARAKRFGIATPDVEAQQKKLEDLKEASKNAEEKKEQRLKAAEEKKKLDEEAAAKKTERQKRFGIAEEEKKPAAEKTPAENKAPANGKDGKLKPAPADKAKESSKEAEAKKA